MPLASMESSEINRSKVILVTGATGYVGARLIPKLLERGYAVRAAGRSLARLRDRSWADHPRVELCEADVTSPDSLKKACAGAAAAFYLVHSMRPGQKDFEAADHAAAENMVKAAEEAGLAQLIYLGGLGDDDKNLSKHLRSRHEVERVLKGGKVPVTILRAAMIIGAGSASFEILRYLVERLPVMITPRWVSTESQPVAIRNVIEYLVQSLEVPQVRGETFDIGGKEILTYKRLMEIYAEEAGLWKRLVIPVPVLTPRLSSYWIHFVTPIHASLARPLAEGLKNRVVTRENRIHGLIPQRLLDAREAIRLALDEAQYRLKTETEEKRWTPPVEWSYPGDPKWAGGVIFEDKRRAVIQGSGEKVWDLIQKIGGDTGWYFADWLWNLRGGLDLLLGGVGMRRGRTNPRQLHVSDAVDFWKIERVEPGKRLMLAAEMKLPGRAILDFQILPGPENTTVLEQTARFIPRGLAGLFYWYLVAPLHGYIFNGMLRAISGRAGNLLKIERC